MSAPPAESVTLAERLADRLCHDIASASQGLASGLDLLAEAGSEVERDEAVGLIAEALAAQKARVAFARRAFGPCEGGEAAELHALAESLFADARPRLVWEASTTRLGPAGARIALVVARIASEALAAGGEARLTIGPEIVAISLAGPRVGLREEVRAGLTGGPFVAGLGGRWVEGAWVAALAAAVRIVEDEGALAIEVSLPPGG